MNASLQWVIRMLPKKLKIIKNYRGPVKKRCLLFTLASKIQNIQLRQKCISEQKNQNLLFINYCPHPEWIFKSWADNRDPRGKKESSLNRHPQEIKIWFKVYKLGQTLLPYRFLSASHRDGAKQLISHKKELQIESHPLAPISLPPSIEISGKKPGFEK